MLCWMRNWAWSIFGALLVIMACNIVFPTRSLSLILSISAPFSSNKSITCWLHSTQAYHKADLPSLSLTLTSAPASSNCSITLTSRDWQMALCNAVWRWLFALFGLAPLSNKTFVTSFLREWRASCNGVFPSWSFALMLTSAPQLIRSLQYLDPTQREILIVSYNQTR